MWSKKPRQRMWTAATSVGPTILTGTSAFQRRRGGVWWRAENLLVPFLGLAKPPPEGASDVDDPPSYLLSLNLVSGVSDCEHLSPQIWCQNLVVSNLNDHQLITKGC